MKLYVYYENHSPACYTWMDVDEADTAVMVERDYEERLAKAAPGEIVERRTAQQILTEEISKPTRNNQQTETRRHVALDALDPEGNRIRNGLDLEEMACGGKYGDLYEAMKQLQPQQQRLLRQIYWEGKTLGQVAEEDRVTHEAVRTRLHRAEAALKKILEKNF